MWVRLPVPSKINTLSPVLRTPNISLYRSCWFVRIGTNETGLLIGYQALLDIEICYLRYKEPWATNHYFPPLNLTVTLQSYPISHWKLANRTSGIEYLGGKTESFTTNNNSFCSHISLELTYYLLTGFVRYIKIGWLPRAVRKTKPVTKILCPDQHERYITP